jgi:hypothetical protein
VAVVASTLSLVPGNILEFDDAPSLWDLLGEFGVACALAGPIDIHRKGFLS